MESDCDSHRSRTPRPRDGFGALPRKSRTVLDPESATGGHTRLWIHGGASTDRASAQWGLSTLGLIADVDDHDDSPPTLQIIIGADAGDSTSLAKSKSNADEAERRQLQDALRNCKKEYAESTLRWFAQRAQINIEKHRLQDPSVKDIRATVRFAEYKDLDLAKDVVKILKECTAWPVELDGSNKPTILPDGDFKVSFDIGSWESFRKVAWAFTYGGVGIYLWPS